MNARPDPVAPELRHTLAYDHLAKRCALRQTTPEQLLQDYTALVTQVTPPDVPRVIANDADDDQVIAAALAAQAHCIVSGDKHLHSLGSSYQGLAIMRPAQAWVVVGEDGG